MPLASPTQIIETALWRFAQGGLETTTAEIANRAYVSTGHLFRTFPTKQALLDACYLHVVAQLAAPLLAGAGQPKERYERLHKQLRRWWLLPAQVALAQPHLFDFWRLYRTRPRTLGGPAPLLGPFEPVPVLIEQVVAQRHLRLRPGLHAALLGPLLAGQWTAALDLVLSDPAGAPGKEAPAQLLEQAFLGWWQSLGLSDFTEVALPPKDAAAAPALSPFWLAVQHYLATGELPPPLPPASA